MKKPEEDRRTDRTKCCVYNNEDEDNSPNILRDKNDFFSFKATVRGISRDVMAKVLDCRLEESEFELQSCY